MDESDAETMSLDEVIVLVDRLDSDDENWETLQWHASDALHDRFLAGGDQDDLASAIERARQVVTAQNESSPPHLLDLALMLWTRLEEDDQRRDVEEYVRLNERALRLCQANPSYAHLVATCQANLATGLMSRNRFEADPQDRDRAVKMWEAALVSDQLDADVRAGIHANIAQAVSSEARTVEELDVAVAHGRRSLTLSTEESDDVAQRHFSLANALMSRTERAPASGLVEEAVHHTRFGLELLGQDHPDYPGYCVNLATELRSLARETGSVAPLKEAETLVREAILPRVGTGHPDHVLALTMGGAILSELAYWHDDRALLVESLDLYQQAIDIADEGSHERGISLVNLASAARDASDRLDDPSLLDLGIRAGEQSLSVFTTPGLHRAAALTATSNLLRDRFVVTGQLDDLDRALSLAEEGLDLTPTGHQEYAARQTNLAVLLSDDYTERATREHLDRAIALYRAALDGPELQARRVSERENDLALALRDRHRDSGLITDLDDAVEHAVRAVEGAPPSAVAWAGYANNYANALADRFEASGDVADLRRAVDLFRQAKRSARARITEASGYGSNLALGLAGLAAVTGRATYLREAVETMRACLSELPRGHPDRAYRLANLADLVRQQSVMTYADGEGDRKDALALSMAAVATAAESVETAGSSNARLLPALANQARAMRWARALGVVTWSAADVLAVQRRAAQLSEISPGERFGQCVAWAKDAREAGSKEDVLSAYGEAVALTPEVAWVGLGTGERMRLLGMMSEVLVEAVHAALAADLPWVGLAWADQVRAVIARQQALVQSLPGSNGWAGESLGSQLTTSRTASTDVPGGSRRERNAREARRAGAHRHAKELRLTSVAPTAYEQLRFPGWLVLLVPGNEASLALIVNGLEGTAQKVELGLTAADLAARVAQLRSATGRFAHGNSEVLDGEVLRHEIQARHDVFAVLAWLWESVARPVLYQMHEQGDEDVHRVWWSLVGDFALLPIHAAGVHPQSPSEWQTAGKGGFDCMSRSAVSSYLPTVSPVGSPYFTNKSQSEESMLFVGVADEERGTPDVALELEAVRREWPDVLLDRLEGDAATTVAIAGGVSKHKFLHVAAHGTGLDESPTGAGFRLRDGVFTWAELAECDASGGRLAVFLTCAAASGNADAPNEALHLAAAARQAGFLDVVATLLPLRENSAAYAVRAIYGSTARNPATVNERLADVVADVANRLRLDPDYGSDPLMWVPYAHFGWGLSESPWGPDLSQ